MTSKVIRHRMLLMGIFLAAGGHLWAAKEDVVNKTVCYKDMFQGPCIAFTTRWYFNATQQKCLNFSYGGCKGNANNFYSEEECQEQCLGFDKITVSTSPTPENNRSTGHRCTPMVESGPCRAAHHRWFYNSTSRDCEEFIYGGCEGNRNNFLDWRKCAIRCILQKKVSKQDEEGKYDAELQAWLAKRKARTATTTIPMQSS